MKLKDKLLYVAALMALLIPFAFMVSTAGAVYVGDGAIQNGTYGDWDITDYGVCFTGIKSDGTMDKERRGRGRGPPCVSGKFPIDKR